MNPSKMSDIIGFIKVTNAISLSGFSRDILELLPGGP
jgi:hypothetical protein